MHTSHLTSLTQAIISGEELYLHPDKAIFYPAEQTLIVSDLHLGKADHFRKAGIPVPDQVNITNIEKLYTLILELEPERVIFLGDLFHSDLNGSWIDFEKVLTDFQDTQFDLVRGNHDILPDAVYANSRMKLYNETLNLGPFVLSHIPLEEPSEGYNLAGHIHPAVVMKGKARQHLRIPCFYFSENQGILPAFGAFTGTYRMRPEGDDQVYVVSAEKVIRVR
ncbi:MAG: ligase-associated DNA damage response endonuclease PdeM [Bacteroidia bacterium]|nr:ligase-associated DNA damage response endonuclease PdeM [Bacteroidia bacterium]